MLHQVRGEKYADPELFTTRLVLRPKIRIAWGVYYPFLAISGLFKLAWRIVFYGLYRFGYVGIPVLFLVKLFADHGWRIGVATIVLVALLLVACWWRWPNAFRRFIGWFYLAQWRRWWVYYRHWHPTCASLKLALTFGGDKYFPTIAKVRRDAFGDLVTVRMVNGQLPEDWSAKAVNLAQTFNAVSCQVQTARHNRIVLHFRSREPLTETVAPFAIPAVSDVEALPVAVRADGQKAVISLLTHVLIAGASGAGKGSVLWAIVSAMAAGIRDGLVKVYAFDPKGGMELDAGRDLFHRFCFGTPEEMANALEELVKEMKQRQASHRGHGRVHEASLVEPTIVVLIDEFGALTSYVTDKKLKERINSAMSLILSQGRAIGVHVVAALQDPRKEILPFRNLFSTRIALRLVEKTEVALILDDDALDRGAACHLIARSLPGKGYMVLDRDPTLVEVRFPFHTDSDIAALASAYAPERPATAFVVNR
ncbi:hypothetical cell division FtsK/SpoIIIE protein [Rhizocola hellebori]|uniref:Hypothetical cell division FtsK/SpoIIIE protein n=1 Tax=Rhizocola hellebori TaxID=1392758 RepID=A0A8J3VJI6_9ACTN|nr:FtsK/SpoIIIE domain-containing protein [Rhizocola hellebori]GIH08096.1 hypothetical cell division FtsK/SpoIIIE protein [Rhizocola hellebori]